jgi:hypothetical protein
MESTMIDIGNIGRYNKQLVQDIVDRKTMSMGYPINKTKEKGGWKHENNYNYDLTYGISGISNKTPYDDARVGIKYYCAKNYEGNVDYDMAKRIVYVHHPKEPMFRPKVYILYHLQTKKGLCDNSYSECHEIVYRTSNELHRATEDAFTASLQESTSPAAKQLLAMRRLWGHD